MDNSITAALRAMEEYYTEYGEKKSLEYAYGFMDAMAVLREMEAAGFDKIHRQIVLSSKPRDNSTTF